MSVSLERAPAQTLRALRRRIIELSAGAQEGHIPSAFSILDIVWTLYERVLRIDPQDPTSDSRDRFLLSKGHASLALYAVLEEKGFFRPDALDGFCSYDSHFGGHPHGTVPGVEASTGSLGHGFPMAVGTALGLRIRGIDAHVYSLIGDGEANEGSVWEACLLGAHHRLSNLTCIVDYNHSTDRALSIGDVAAKFRAFDWAVHEIDGHDGDAIYQALTAPDASRPNAVVATTIKGYGCPSMHDNPAWHHKSPTPAELSALIESLT